MAQLIGEGEAQSRNGCGWLIEEAKTISNGG
jgi:hypothetical protein